MKLTFPSLEFDKAVAAVCHGTASDEQARALNEMLRNNASARDEYILRLELHSRLASEPDLFPPANALPENVVSLQAPRRTRTRKANWVLALAACVALLAAGWRANGKPLLFDGNDQPKRALDAVIGEATRAAATK